MFRDKRLSYERELIPAVAEAEWHHQRSGQEVHALYMYTHYELVTISSYYLITLPVFSVFFYTCRYTRCSDIARYDLSVMHVASDEHGVARPSSQVTIVTKRCRRNKSRICENLDVRKLSRCVLIIKLYLLPRINFLSR